MGWAALYHGAQAGVIRIFDQKVLFIFSCSLSLQSFAGHERALVGTVCWIPTSCQVGNEYTCIINFRTALKASIILHDGINIGISTSILLESSKSGVFDLGRWYIICFFLIDHCVKSRQPLGALFPTSSKGLRVDYQRPRRCPSRAVCKRPYICIMLSFW